jgi:hypothetical protein
VDHPVVFVLEFRGEAVAIGDGRWWAETRARSESFGEEAICRRELSLQPDGSLSQTGEITFGLDNGLTFSAVGAFDPKAGGDLRHGAAVCEVTGGRGTLSGARGFLTSNFLLAATGELTDHHLGLLFLEQPD